MDALVREGRPGSGTGSAAAAPRQPARRDLAYATAQIAFRAVRNLGYMVFASLARFRFWWLERQGRTGEVEAIIHRMTLNWTASIFAGLECRIEVEGAELVPAEGPLLVLPNHQSLYDIPLLMGWLGRPVGFVFKRELLRFPGLRYWMHKTHGFAIDRGEHREAAEQYERWGGELAGSGRALVIFPEGTRSRDPQGALGPFRRGALRLASPRRISVLPVVIDGTRFLVRPHALAVTPAGRRVIRMRILPPVATAPMSPPEAKLFMDNLRETMLAAREAIRVDWSARQA